MVSSAVSSLWSFCRIRYVFSAAFTVFLCSPLHVYAAEDAEKVNHMGWYWQGYSLHPDYQYSTSLGACNLIKDYVRDGYDAGLTLCKYIGRDQNGFKYTNHRLVDETPYDKNRAICVYNQVFADGSIATADTGHCMDRHIRCPANATESVMAESCQCNFSYVSDPDGLTCYQPTQPILGKFKDEGDPQVPKDEPQICAGNPINATTGHKFQKEIDYQSPNGRLDFIRYYNSSGVFAGWRHNWSHFIRWGDEYSREVYLARADGKTLGFNFADGAAVGYSDADIQGTLTRLYDSNKKLAGWQYLSENRVLETYRKDGRLQSIGTPDGQLLVLGYSDGTLTDTVLNDSTKPLPAGFLTYVYDYFSQRALHIYYNAQYKLAAVVATPDEPTLTNNPSAQDQALVWTYSFVNGKLQQVTYPDLRTRSYVYENTTFPYLLTGIFNNGQRYATWSYDTLGRATSSEHGSSGSGIDKTTLKYNAGNTIITDALGVERTLYYTSVANMNRNKSVSLPNGSGCISSQNKVDYDARGNITRTIDFAGNSTCYAYENTRNLEIYRVEGLKLASGTSCPADLASYTPSTATGSVERKISTKWHSTYRVPTQIAEPKRLTTFTYYEAVPNVLDGATPAGLLQKVSIQATKDETGGSKFSPVIDTAVPKRETSYTYYPSITPSSTEQTFTTSLLSRMPPGITGLPNAKTGKIKSITDSRSNIQSYTYNDLGALASVTNTAKHLTTLSHHDGFGRPLQIKDANGLITTVEYSNRDRLSSINRGGEIMRLTYTADGDLDRVTYPDNSYLDYDYDEARRLTRIVDNAGNRISYVLDKAGKPIAEGVVENGKTEPLSVHTRLYDKLGNLWQEVGHTNQMYEYDTQGNVRRIIASDSATFDVVNTSVSGIIGYQNYLLYSGLGMKMITGGNGVLYNFSNIALGAQNTTGNRVTTLAHDALNRLTSVTDANGGIAKYSYNGQNQLIQVTDPRNLVTKYMRDGLGNTSQLISPDTGTSNAIFDAAGNLKTYTDANGQQSNYTYDALNRLTGITYTNASGYNTVYTYDTGTYGVGHLTQVTDPTGTTSLSYNQKGYLISETRVNYGATYVTKYGYDAMGRLNSITYPSGRVVSYLFDTQGRINKISSTYGSQSMVLASNILYFPFGGVKSFTYGDGLTQPVQTYSRSLDQTGHLSSYTLGKQSNNGALKGNLFSVNYDTAGQINRVNNTDLSNNTALTAATYGYDALSRLTGYTQGSITQTYKYDAVGNRTSQTLGTATTTYGYETTSNRLANITKGGVTSTLIHDKNGSITTDPERSKYIYDARGRLISTTTAANGAVTEYGIDAFGLRIKKKGTDSDTVYHYNLQGQLIAESVAGSNTVLKEYIYLGDLPIAVLQ